MGDNVKRQLINLYHRFRNKDDAHVPLMNENEDEVRRRRKRRNRRSTTTTLTS